MERADAQYTAALNAWNESYGARQSLVLMKANRAALLKQASDELYKEDPKLEPWLVERVGSKMNRPLKFEPLDVIALEWQVPFLIESAGVEDAALAVDRLGVRGVRGRGGFDVTPVDPRTDPLGQLRQLFDKTNQLGRLGGRNFLEPGAFMPPPQPTLSEAQALERDCRLKRMAEAERLVPRIAPQVRFLPALELLGDLNGEGGRNGGIELYRGSESRPLYLGNGTPTSGTKMNVGWRR